MMLSRCVLPATVAVLLLAAPLQTATAGEVVTRRNGKTVVKAPTTRVVVGERSGRTQVRVRAPHTAVDVDTGRRRVRINVPYFHRVIGW